MTDYTPGPWKVFTCMGNGDYHWIVDDLSEEIPLARVNFFPMMPIDFEDDPEKVGLANAELIASAPRLKEEHGELLEALVDAVDWMKFLRSSAEAAEPLNRAIARMNELIAKVEK